MVRLNNKKVYYSTGDFLIERSNLIDLLCKMYGEYIIKCASYNNSIWQKIVNFGVIPHELTSFDSYVHKNNRDLWNAKFDAKYYEDGFIFKV